MQLYICEVGSVGDLFCARIISFSSLGKAGIKQIYGMRKSDTTIGEYGNELVKVGLKQ